MWLPVIWLLPSSLYSAFFPITPARTYTFTAHTLTLTLTLTLSETYTVWTGHKRITKSIGKNQFVYIPMWRCVLVAHTRAEDLV